MPTVQAPHHRRRYIPIVAFTPRQTLRIEGEPHIWPGVRLLAHMPRIVECGEAPRPAEVVLGTGAAPGGVFVIAIDVHLDLALAPPAAFQRGQRQIRAHIRAAPAHTVEHHIVAAGFGESFATPLRVEAHHILRQLVIRRVVDLVEERWYVLVMVVAQHDARMTERHGPVAVEPPVGIDHHRNRIDPAGLCMPAAEEVADRTGHRRGILAIPIAFQDQIAQHIRAGGAGAVGHGHPDMPDHARTLHIHQGYGLSGGDGLDARAALARGTQRAGGHGGTALSPVGVLRVDATGPPA